MCSLIFSRSPMGLSFALFYSYRLLMLAVMSLTISAFSESLLMDGVDDCTVIPAAELLADLVQREVGHPSDLIHSDLAGQHDVLGPALAP